MKKYLFLLGAVLLANSLVYAGGVSPHTAAAELRDSEVTLQRAYATRQSRLQVRGEGAVVRILADDLSGSRHQRFLLALSSGQTVLIAHNIDLAPRLDALKIGDRVGFYGEYAWNPKGGVIHWTHHDPHGHHVSGWLKHAGRVFQ